GRPGASSVPPSGRSTWRAWPRRGILRGRFPAGGLLMATVQKETGMRRRRWSKEEYYRLGELGFFHGQRVELIEGELMVQSPQNPLHANGVDLVDEVLT